VNLTGRWAGHYLQGGKEYPIAADFLGGGEGLSGFMYDGQPDRDYSVFQASAEAGLPPGADEQIEARLRELVPGASAAPIRYVTHLPPNSTLRGRRTDRAVYFLKSYQGTSFSGYQVGDRLVGARKEGHEVHYEGQLSPDGQTLEGQWWIDADPESGAPRSEGLFRLRRSEAGEARTNPPATRQVKQQRPWWQFWS
jgi:hypothetical protein